MTHHWPRIAVKRFHGEAQRSYEQRRAEIVAIMEGFRKSRFSNELAEKLDQRLDDLLTGLADGSRPDPYGLLRAEETRQPARPSIYLVAQAS
jgi:hypothetical protein